MLGSMVYRFLSSQTKLAVTGTCRNHQTNSPLIEFDAHEFLKTGQAPGGFDYFVNCIALTKPHCPDNDPAKLVQAELINSKLPLELSKFCAKNHTRLIHISTDGVFSGLHAPYDESSTPDPTDAYGRSKLLGEIDHPSCLTIRCSILGPDPIKKQGLLEWLLSQKPGSTIKGFSHHIWNGVTTLEFAKLCLALTQNNLWQAAREESYVHHFAPVESISKYDLCKLINEVFDLKLKVEKVAEGTPCDRTIKSQYSAIKGRALAKDYPSSVQELRDYMES